MNTLQELLQHDYEEVKRRYQYVACILSKYFLTVSHIGTFNNLVKQIMKEYIWYYPINLCCKQITELDKRLFHTYEIMMHYDKREININDINKQQIVFNKDDDCVAYEILLDENECIFTVGYCHYFTNIEECNTVHVLTINLGNIEVGTRNDEYLDGKYSVDKVRSLMLFHWYVLTHIISNEYALQQLILVITEK